MFVLFILIDKLTIKYGIAYLLIILGNLISMTFRHLRIVKLVILFFV